MFGRGDLTLELEESHLDLPETDRTLVAVRPYKNTAGFDVGNQFIRSFHSERSRPITSFELWSDRKLRLIIGTDDPDELATRIDSTYPNTTVDVTDDRLPEGFQVGNHLAGASIGLERDSAFPLRTTESRTALDGDPYVSILGSMVGTDHDSSILQLVFQPVSSQWDERGVIGSTADLIADGLREGEVVGELNPRVVTSDRAKRAAKDIQNQAAKIGFRVSIRALACAETPATATHRIEAVVESLDELTNPDTKQTLIREPIGRRHLKTALDSAAYRSPKRQHRLSEYLFGPTATFTEDELAALCHLPAEADVPQPALDWARMESGPGVPADDYQHTIN